MACRLRGRRFYFWMIGLMSLVVLYSTRPSLDLPMATHQETTSSTSSWNRYQSNRSIAIIHVGKAGGLSLRAMTSLKCRLPRNQVTPESLESCLQETYGTSYNNTHPNPLAVQTIYYAHMRSLPANELHAATSWLWVLRNPVDRVISAYAYSHPANCQDTVWLLPNSTKGCTNFFLLQQQQQQQPQSLHRLHQSLVPIFQDCFPQASMELFVQTALKKHDQPCGRLARTYLMGQGPLFPIPHLVYNYQYYYQNVAEAYAQATKEWFGIRTEHLQHDFRMLNRNLGAPSRQEKDDDTTMETIKVTHGSERFHSTGTTSLTQNSYQGLCCLLVNEMTIYLELVQRMWNWDPAEKASTFYELAKPCGIASERAEWSSLWRALEVWKKTTCRELVAE